MVRIHSPRPVNQNTSYPHLIVRLDELHPFVSSKLVIWNCLDTFIPPAEYLRVDSMARRKNAGKQHFKVTMFFPLEDNEGKPFDPATWNWWHDRIKNLISGLTDLGIVDGWWQGRSDRNKWVITVVEGVTQLDELRRFLRLSRTRFRQDAMYFEWHQVYFELVT